MDEVWACSSCHSVNAHGAKACYKCGASGDNEIPLAQATAPARPEVTVEVPATVPPALPRPRIPRLPRPQRRLIAVALVTAVAVVGGTAFVLARNGATADPGVGALPTSVAATPSAPATPAPSDIDLRMTGAIRAHTTTIAADLSAWYCLPTRTRFVVRLPKRVGIVRSHFSHDRATWVVTIVVRPIGARADNRKTWTTWRWDGGTGSVRPTPTTLIFDRLELRTSSGRHVLRLNGWVACTGFHDIEG
jgi:hypothetical protein